MIDSLIYVQTYAIKIYCIWASMRFLFRAVIQFF